jgi:hypothetical protein
MVILAVYVDRLVHVATLWKPLNTAKIEPCTITCANVQSEVQRLVVELESMYITLSMDRDCKYSDQLSLENSNVLSILVEKG